MQEAGAREGQQVPGPAGAEGRHQGGGADLRDAEEPFEVAAGEEFAVERFELADGVGMASSQRGLAGTALPDQPSAGIEDGRIYGGHLLRQVSVDDRS